MKHSLLTAGLLACSSMLFADNSDDFSQKTWTTWNGKGTVVKTSINKEEGSAAKGSLQLVFPKGTTGGSLKNFPVEPNSFYTAEIMVKSADKDASFELAAHDFGADNKYRKIMTRKSFPASTEWKKITLNILTGSNTKFVRILPSVKTQPNIPAFFDDFKLTKVEGIDEKDAFDFTNEWSMWKPAVAKVKFSIDKNEGNSAAPAAKIEFLPGNPAKGSATLMRNISILPGKTYTMSVWVKAKGIAPKTKISLGFQSKDENLKYLGLQIPSTFITAENCTEWKQIVLTRKITPTGNWAKVRNILITLGVSGSTQPGTVLFDDFEIFTEETEEE